MIRKSVDITGTGPHAVLPAAAGMTNVVWRMVLTFAHQAAEAQKVTFLSGTDVVAGPFYVLDGGEIAYNASGEQRLPLATGAAFNIGLSPDVSCAGLIDYEVGER